MINRKLIRVTGIIIILATGLVDLINSPGEFQAAVYLGFFSAFLLSIFPPMILMGNSEFRIKSHPATVLYKPVFSIKEVHKTKDSISPNRHLQVIDSNSVVGESHDKYRINTWIVGTSSTGDQKNKEVKIPTYYQSDDYLSTNTLRNTNFYEGGLL